MISSRLRRWKTISVLCLVALVAAPLAQPAAAQSEVKPVAVVALSGVDALIEDVNFVGSLIGMGEMGNMYKPMFMGYINGLDTTKPIGVIIQSDGADFSGAACLPVTDLANILNTIKMFGVQSEDVGDGVKKIVTPQQPVFIKENAGWAFVAPMQEMLAQIPQNPEQLISELNKEYDLAASLDVQNIPEPQRQWAMEQIEGALQMGMRQLPDETEEQYEERLEVSKLQMEQLKEFANSVDDLTIGLALDGDDQRAYFDFVYTAIEGSKLADQIKMMDEAKTNYAGFYQPDAAATMTFTTKMTEADIANVDQMFVAIRNQLKTAIDKEADLPTEAAKDTVKAAMDDFVDAIVATLKTGVMDGGMLLNLAPSSLTFVAGGHVGEPEKIVSGLKKLEGVFQEEDDFPGIQWDAESHAGISFHTMSIPIPAGEAEVIQILGPTLEVAVGIGKESAFFALGRECMESAKAVIDASQANAGKDVPPMEVTVSLEKIMEMAASVAEGQQKPMLQMIASALATESAGRDHVRIVSEVIPRGVRTRFEAEEGVLRAIGMAVMQAQAQAAGAGF